MTTKKRFLKSSHTRQLFMQSKAKKWRLFGSGGWILIPNETPDKTDSQNVLYGTQITLCWALFHDFCSFVLRHLCSVNEVKVITPIKLHQIFICDETCFSWDQTLAFAFLLFHLRWHVKKSDFVLRHGFQTPRKRRKRSASGLCFYLFLDAWTPWSSTNPSFMTYYMKRYKCKIIPLWETVHLPLP